MTLLKNILLNEFDGNMFCCTAFQIKDKPMLIFPSALNNLNIFDYSFTSISI